ncbi:HAD hydrolase family protein [Candidatus Saccharibacteria bacterium]|nr:HAD hydrolase family protein [Candidatus Saccharibacteria bacterium]
MYLTNNTRILVSDFDFTIMEHGNPHITTENLQAIKRWREKGNLFIIASGRSLPSITLEMHNYADYADFLILNDGATVISSRGEKVRSDRMMEPLIEKFKDALLEQHLRGEYATISYYGSRELNYIKPGCCKFRMWFKYLEDCKKIETLIEEKFSKKLQCIVYPNVVGNHDTRLDWISDDLLNTLEVNCAGTDKKSALDYLLDMLYIRNPSDRIITIGDDFNDLRMLEAYNGYTLEHARHEVIKRIPSSRVYRHLYELITDQLKALA